MISLSGNWFYHWFYHWNWFYHNTRILILHEGNYFSLADYIS